MPPAWVMGGASRAHTHTLSQRAVRRSCTDNRGACAALQRADERAPGSLGQAAVTEDGALYTWGHGGYGQLGHDSRDNTQVPRVVAALAGIRVLMTSVRQPRPE